VKRRTVNRLLITAVLAAGVACLVAFGFAQFIMGGFIAVATAILWGVQAMWSRRTAATNSEPYRERVPPEITPVALSTTDRRGHGRA